MSSIERPVIDTFWTIGSRFAFAEGLVYFSVCDEVARDSACGRLS
jgi:hypothetical protein